MPAISNATVARTMNGRFWWIVTLIITLVVLAWIFASHTIVYAHNTFNSPAILANGSSKLIKENTFPQPAQLPWAAHYVDLPLAVGESLTLSALRDTIASELEYAPEDVYISWKLSTGQQVAADDITSTFNATGNYYFTVVVTDQTSDILYEEEISATVGTPPTPAGIKVTKEEEELVGSNLVLARQGKYEFSVAQPDSANYEYVWDTADGQVVSAETVTLDFASAELPAYIVLRTIDRESQIYADSYVRIDSDDEPEYKVLAPPNVGGPAADEPMPTQHTQPNRLLVVIVLTLAAMMLGSITFTLHYFRKQAAKRRGKH